MDRIRHAGWLVWIPPIVLGVQYLRDVDLDSSRSDLAHNFLISQFGFMSDELPSDFKPRAFINLVLFLAAIVVGFMAIVLGQARTAVIVVAAAQGLVAFVGLVWDYTGRDVPEAIAHTILAPGGRWTSFVYLVFAGIALGLALSAPRRVPVGFPPPVTTF